MSGKCRTVVLNLIMLLAITPGFAQDQSGKKNGDKVKVSAKELVEVKRQMRLMRAEMADLEEKIEQMTALRDNVYTSEKVSKKDSEEKSH